MKLSILGVFCLGSLASASALVGCSPASDDWIASGRGEVIIDPGDTENWANLTLALPTTTCLPGLTCTRPLSTTPSLYVDDTEVTLGTATRLKPGDHMLSANNAMMKITLAAGAMKTFIMPVARSKCTPVMLPTVVSTDFGKTPVLTNAACPTNAVGTNMSAVTLANLENYHTANCNNHFGNFTGVSCGSYPAYTIYSVRIAMGECINITPKTVASACNAAKAGDFSWIDSGTKSSLRSYDQVLLPDTYTLTVGNTMPPTTQKFTLAEGDLTDVAISLPVVGNVSALFNTNITFADTRMLTTVNPPTITSSCSGDRTYTVPNTASGTVNLKAYSDSSCVYSLTAAGVTKTISQTTTASFTLYRVDVKDVTVRKEDGSTYVTRGTYELYLGGSRVAGPYSTNTGIDALPGTYEIVISYTTADGPKSQKQTFTL